jgi:hypothetical protein
MNEMKKSYFIRFVISLVCLAVWLASCTEDKVYDIVIGDSLCPQDTFVQNSASEVFTDTVYVEMGTNVDDALAEYGYSRSSIKTAVLNGGFYTVTEFTPPVPYHDWRITGSVMIQRIDVPGPEDTLISYVGRSVEAALGIDVVTPLHEDGVGVINQALADFLDDPTVYPSFRLVVLNGNCTPDPSEADRIKFKWLTCLQLQLIGTDSSDTLDPF